MILRRKKNVIRCIHSIADTFKGNF